MQICILQIIECAINIIANNVPYNLVLLFNVDSAFAATGYYQKINWSKIKIKKK